MSIDRQRRKVVMARSMRLGHCVCNPRQGCPCDVFRTHDVCRCAGERLPVRTDSVALTQVVRKAGCASKIGQADLLRVLGQLPAVTDPNVLLGAAAGDDAGVYRLTDDCALVQTVDVFTPCVDDPFLFGRIAAANSVSDVYAMGGKPISALSIVGFPIEELDDAILTAMLRGAMATLAEADCALIGGHSINDEEIKLGFAVTGVIRPDQAVARKGARPGDALVLTKPLGTGLVAFGAQLGRISDTALAAVGAHMAALNRDAADLMVEYGAHACTDVTGFGLAGHLVEMLRDSAVAAEIDLAQLPVFAAAVTCLEQEIIPGAVERNQSYSAVWVRSESDTALLPVLFDPQTSGGLLIALPPDRAVPFVEAMRVRGHEATAVVGRITAADAAGKGLVTVVNADSVTVIGRKETATMEDHNKPAAGSAGDAEASRAEAGAACCAASTASCCESAAQGATVDPEPASEATPVGDGLALFRDFMAEANRPGLVDQRSKKLMAVALSISHRCRPCLKVHMTGALEQGIPLAELDEAAALAIAFGGCSAMMFYREVSQEVRREMRTPGATGVRESGQHIPS